jgi:NAD(P)-dependent dehydrogenase (short-subunit alcohol dehydrogenase family)
VARELAGKVAVVTGGSSGIGRATVELFADQGANVVIADVDSHRGKELAEKIGPQTAFKRTDVADAEQVQELVDFAVETYGGLHVMFNNAGMSSAMRRFLHDDLNDFTRVMNVNLFGAMVGCQRAARHMLENGGGSIINNASIAGLNAGAGLVTYRASKAAVIHVTRSIAIDVAPYGIRVNCVAPAHIQAAITNYDIETVARFTQPLPRRGQPEDVANAVLYLASERSAQVTGVVLPVDGGTTAGPPVTQLKAIMAAPQPGSTDWPNAGE